MPTVSSDVSEPTEVTLESLCPVSTLRSTASPYKHNRNHSLFNLYLSQLTSDALSYPLDFSKSSGSPAIRDATFSCPPSPTTREMSPKSALNVLDEGLDTRTGIYTRSELEYSAETMFDTPSIRPSSPFAVTSSPSSAAADISSLSSLIQSNEDEDDAATESDRPDSPTPSSPFSSPLSTAPSSPATTLITIISPVGVVSTTTTRPRALKRSREPRDLVSDTEHTRQKRPRSPSPPQIPTRSTYRSRTLKSLKGLGSGSAAHHKASRPSSQELSPRSLQVSKDLIGPLIQVLTLSGKSSMPTSSVVNEMLSSTPSMCSERSVEEWRNLAVVTMSKNSVFGRAERVGLKNAKNEVIEDEWYYRPENDDDSIRRGMLGAFQRGGGKRRATVEKKQYYWKPVK